MQVTIRDDVPSDHAAIDGVHARAFAGSPHGDQGEHRIVRALREDGALTVSLVAVSGALVVGHVAVSPVAIADGSLGWYGLGPVGVVPERQREGIGGRLVEEALRRLRAADAAGCVLLGDPGYYARFGFRADPGLVLPGVPAEAFQRVCFSGQRAAGVVSYHPAFGVEA